LINRLELLMDSDSKPTSLKQTLTKIAVVTAFTTLCALIAVTVMHLWINKMVTQSAASIEEPDPKTPRPIDAADTVFMEEMTWMEVRDAKAAGKTTVILATGGVEQCGPYLATGKHNYVCRATSEALARKLGNALVAPIVPFVPQGDIDPPTAHMKYPGTVSLTEDTYRRLLTEICECYRVQGFERLILIADSYGNQEGMADVAKKLSERWKGKPKIYYVPEYHDSGDRYHEWLNQQAGIDELKGHDGFHDNFGVTAVLMSVDPARVRYKERVAAGKDRINGVSISPAENTIKWGKRIVEWRVGETMKAIERIEGKTPEEKKVEKKRPMAIAISVSNAADVPRPGSRVDVLQKVQGVSNVLLTDVLVLAVDLNARHAEDRPNVIGGTATIELRNNEEVLKLARGPLGPPLSLAVKRQVTVPITATDYCRFIKPGVRVDVVYEEAGKPTVLVENAKVLIEPVPSDNEGLAMLEVNAEEASKLNLEKKPGKLSLVMRQPVEK
jgi:creatinine amidohydrolase/Fe(II)-dependent formamide hydrolase-like protein